MPEGQETGSTDTGSSGSAESESTVAGRVADATKAVREAASSASGMVGEAYEQGSGYLRDASDRLPNVGKYAEFVRWPREQSPLITALAVGAIGYLAAYLIHGGGFGSLQRSHTEGTEQPSKRSRRRHRG
jgi:hypothetical protein